MIANQPLGGRQIIYTNRLSPSSTGVTHDPWHHHATGYSGSVLFQASSYLWFPCFTFTLLDGNDYDYWLAGAVSFDDGAATLVEYQHYTNPDGLTGFFGEWWNFVGRPGVFSKSAMTNRDQWLMEH